MDRLRQALMLRLGDSEAPVIAVVGGLWAGTVTALLALFEDRLPFALLHPRWRRAERDRALAMAGASLCIESGGAIVPVRTASGSAAVGRGGGVVFTSGTEGAPRGVVLSRAALLASSRAHAAVLGWRADDRWLLSLPAAHVGGLMIVVRCLHARRAVVVGGRGAAGRFDAGEALRVVERDRVTLWSVVPTMLLRLLQLRRRPPPYLRAVLVGGAPAPLARMAAARDLGWPVFATYGLTEACSQVATERPGGVRGGAGPPLPGMEVSIGAADSGGDARVSGGTVRDVGDAAASPRGGALAAGEIGSIRIRGPMLFDGYLGDRPAAPLELPLDAEGWFDTGDLGAVDGQGCLRVVGRRADRIVTGGENVDPAEVEAAVLEWRGVAAVCVVGLADQEWGEKVGAVVVPAGGFERDGGIEELERRLGARLAGFKRPRRWLVVELLPVAPSGKVDREACRRLLMES